MVTSTPLHRIDGEVADLARERSGVAWKPIFCFRHDIFSKRIATLPATTENECMTRRQTCNTRTRIFNVGHIVAYLSRFMPVMAGDVIITGTPSRRESRS